MNLVRARRMQGHGVMAVLLVGVLSTLWFGSLLPAERAAKGSDPSVRPRFREPVTLASRDGVLEVRLTAHQARAHLDTVAKPVENFFLYAYEVIQGRPSDGHMSGDNVYPGPTLQVSPGDTLIVHLENALAGLTIRDNYNPAFIPKGKEVPFYPAQLTEEPINLHTHGLRISPKGNSDNVLLHIGPGLSNTYTYRIRKDHPQGAYWYHPHLHGLTSPQVYRGLIGLLAIGRTDGNIPLVTKNSIPIRNMLLQYNYVYDRKGGLAELGNPNWPQFVSTLEPPKGDQLAKGTYHPLLTPTNFSQSKKGTEHFTVWWAGKLSIYNNRGRFQYIPSNLQRFTPKKGGAGQVVPADLSLPDYQRDVQYTVNGLFQPIIESKPGQTEIWVLANVSDEAYMNVQLTETATGRHPKIAILGEDGNPGSAVRYPVTHGGTRLLLPPASRYAIAVTMPEKGDLILEMPPRGGGAVTISEPGILYTNNGTDNFPAVTGSLSILPSGVSYDDGFFLFPTQVLARALPAGDRGVTTPFLEGQLTHAHTGFTDVSRVTPDFKRRLDVTGGFLNDLANKQDPKTFVYAFNGQGFPNGPLLQPRLDSVEEWTFANYNNDQHPIHVHVNDFQVSGYFDPTTGLRTGPAMWGVDNANLAAPTMAPNQDVIQPAELSIRTKFEHYTGLFVMHCHRLNHEDNGLMVLVNIIPAVSAYSVAIPGSPGRTAAVKVYDGEGDRLLAKVTPFPGYEGTPSVAMGDVNGDSIYDLVVGAGKDHAPEVVVYSGKADGGSRAFQTELTRFEAFGPDARGGINVTSAQIDGTTADNIIVGSGPGVPNEVKVFAYKPSAPPDVFSSFSPYSEDRSGVSVASGFVDFTTGRNSIVTASGPGSPARVKVFVYPLFTRGTQTNGVSENYSWCALPWVLERKAPVMTGEFMPFGDDYHGGVSLATGWLFGSLGGTKRIVVGQLTGPGRVKVYSSGSARQGGPEIYLQGPVEHGQPTQFSEAFSFTPFGGDSGVRVATTSTTTGAHLLVSGVSAQDKTAKVLKYDLVRPNKKTTDLKAVQVSAVASTKSSAPHALGGD